MPRGVLAPWTALVTLLSSAPAWADGDLQKGPYLLHVSESAADLRVELAKAAPLTVEVTAEPRADAAPPKAISSPSQFFHSVHLSGLAPATRYRYSVRVLPSGAPHAGSFVTAPGATSHAPFTFALYGDNRSDGPAHERVVQAMGKESFDFLVNTGDFVIAGDDDAAWQSFFDIEAPLLSTHPFYGCIGNHELHSDQDAAHFERYLGPSEAEKGEPTTAYGSFRWGRARFFLLNAFDDWSHGPARTWLDDALGKADHEAGIDTRIAVLHQGPYSSGPHGGSKAILAARVDELFTRHHVDLVLAGHDHIYERGDGSGLKYLISGGGGAPLYREIKPVASTLKAEATYHYVLITVNDEGVSTLAKRPDGTIVDQCSFVRGGPWLCDPKPKAESKLTVSPAPPPAEPSARCSCDVVGGPSRGDLFVFGAFWPALLLYRRRVRAA